MRFRKKKGLSLKGLLIFFCILIMNLLPLSTWAASPVEAKIPVSCIAGNTNEVFTVHLQIESEEFQHVEKTSLSLKGGDKDFFRINYTYPGTYRYQIYQDKGSDGNTTYDETVYVIDVYVTEDENGVMHTEPVIFEKGNDGKCAEATFTNSKEVHKGTIAKPVNTGDATQMMMYILLIGISAGVLAILLCLMKRRKGGEN